MRKEAQSKSNIQKIMDGIEPIVICHSKLVRLYG